MTSHPTVYVRSRQRAQWLTLDAQAQVGDQVMLRDVAGAELYSVVAVDGSRARVLA